MARLTPEERLELAFRLGEEDLEAYRRSRGLDRAEALRQLELRKQSGRRDSGCIQTLIRGAGD